MKSRDLQAPIPWFQADLLSGNHPENRRNPVVRGDGGRALICLQRQNIKPRMMFSSSTRNQYNPSRYKIEDVFRVVP